MTQHKKQFLWRKDKLVVRAPAKINLMLLIAGKRPDGFHEIETIMAKVNWYDELTIETRSEPGIEVTCNGPYWAPEGKDNLIYKACELFFRNCGKTPQIKVTLTKNIPAGTGLGSASSDAAAALMGLNQFAKLNIGLDQLETMAAKLGSDVNFFLGEPLALCTGRGEKIEKIEKRFDFSALLFIFDINVSTKAVYEAYKHDSKRYSNLKEELDTFLRNNDIYSAAKKCINMLESTCFSLHGQLSELKCTIEALGIGPVALSGSGSAMYYLLGEKDRTQTAAHQKLIKNSVNCESVVVSNNRW